MPTFPTRVEEIDADWLTRALRADGLLSEGRVASLELEPLGEPGQASVVVRVRPEYQDAPETAPATMIAKLPPTFEGARAQMQAVGAFDREVRFYQQLGDDAGIPVPHAYAAEVDDTGGEFVLLTEDLSAGRNGDFFIGSLQDVEAALDVLPAFHARWWQNEQLRSMPWVLQPDDVAYYTMLGQLLAAFVPQLEQRYPQHFTGYLRDAARRLAERWDAYWPIAPGAEWTLVHFDYHPKQIFFPGETGGRFAVFDWQTAGLAMAAMDVHRIMLFGLDREQFAEHHERLALRYHAALAEAGVDYPVEQLMTDFRKSMLVSLFISVFALATTDYSILEQAAEARGVDCDARMFGDLAAALELARVIDVIP